MSPRENDKINNGYKTNGPDHLRKAPPCEETTGTINTVAVLQGRKARHNRARMQHLTQCQIWAPSQGHEARPDPPIANLVPQNASLNDVQLPSVANPSGRRSVKKANRTTLAECVPDHHSELSCASCTLAGPSTMGTHLARTPCKYCNHNGVTVINLMRPCW